MSATPEPDWADTAETRILDQAVLLARRGLWSDRLARRSAEAAGLSPAEAELVIPYGGRDLAALLVRRHDSRALERLGAVDPANLKIRQRIRTAVAVRVEAALDDEAATRAAALFLALPPNAALGLRLGWETADGLWRWAGDVSADENHYSKRAILGAVLGSTLAVRLAAGQAAAETHLDRALQQVMRFETWKARLPKLSGLAAEAASALGRARYGAART